MKLLKDRTEIAKAMNFGKYPVITIDLSNKPAKSWAPDSDYAVGDRVRVAWDEEGYEGMTTKGNVYFEKGKFAIDQNAAVLKKDFGRIDILENASWASTTIVHAGQEVLLVIDNSEQDECKVAIMKVSDRIDINCETVAYLEELEG